MKNFLQRALTGILFVLLLVVAIIEQSTLYVLVFSLFIALALREFYGLLQQKQTPPSISLYPAIFSGVYLFIASYACLLKGYTPLLLLPYLLYIIYLVISEIYKKGEDPILNIAYALLGQIYVALPFALYNLLIFIPNAQFYYSPTATEALMGGAGDLAQFLLWGKSVKSFVFPLAFFVFIWLNDTGAYLAGITLGKHRLFERISPKKSWEGFIGGALLDVVVAIVLSYFLPLLSTIEWIGMALIVVIVGTYGDLWESLIKRTIGVKDSGNILPGHGGILDRLDSALLAIPAVTLYLYMVLL